MSINLVEALEYKTGSSITGAIKKSLNPQLESLKPYTNLSKEQVNDILEIIKDLLPKTKKPLIEKILSDDSDTSDISNLEMSEPKALPKGKDMTILQSLCDSLKKIPLTDETKYDKIRISKILEELGIDNGTDVHTKTFYRLNNIIGLNLALPQAIKTHKGSQDTYFKDKTKIVQHCILNNKYNEITVEQMLFIVENPYMFTFENKIYPCDVGAYGVNIFGHDYKYTTFDKIDLLEKKLKTLLTV